MRKWKRFKTAANIPRTGCTKKLTWRSDCATLRQTTRNPRARHETPQASLSMLKVKLMTVQLENDWTRIAYMEGIPGGNLVSLHSTSQVCRTVSEQTTNMTTNTSYQLLFQPRDLDAWHLLNQPLGHSTGQWPQAQQQIYNRMGEIQKPRHEWVCYKVHPFNSW